MTDKTYTADELEGVALRLAGGSASTQDEIIAADATRAYAATLRQAGAVDVVEAKAREMYEAHRSERPDARMYSWDQQPFAPTKEHWREKAKAALARPASSEPESGEASTGKDRLQVAGPAKANEACRRAFCAEDGYGEARLRSRDFQVFRDGYFCSLNERSENSGQLPAAWIIRKRNTHPMDSIPSVTTHDGDAADHMERGDDVTPLYTHPAEPVNVPEGFPRCWKGSVRYAVDVLTTEIDIRENDDDGNREMRRNRTVLEKMLAAAPGADGEVSRG